MRPTENEQLCQKLWKWSKDPILLLESDGTIIEVNKASEIVFGYESEELIGEKVFELFDQDFVQLFNNQNEWSKIKGKYVTKQGIEVKTESTCEKVELDNWTGWVLFLEGQKDQLILDGLQETQDPVLIHHLGKILFANDACVDMLEVERDELLYQNVFDYIHGDHQEYTQERVRVSNQYRGMEPTTVKAKLPSSTIRVFVAPTPVFFQGKACTQVYMKPVKEQALSDELIFGNLKIDIEHQSLYKDNKQIALSSKEFLILLKLVRSANEPVTVQELYQSIWGGRELRGYTYCHGSP